MGLEREPENAAAEYHDLVVVGGGIYGVMLCIEAVRRGLHPLLVEKDDFGSHTSFNSLRIIHGGFRYLQTFDLHRFRESVGERRWFLRTFPNFVNPLPCLMPLYGKGVKRKPVLRIALKLNDLLSSHRNDGVLKTHHLPNGFVISPSETRNRFNGVNRNGLEGAAVWYDAFMPDSQLLLMAVIRWACDKGASVLNYMTAKRLVVQGNAIEGIECRDEKTGCAYRFKTPLVINACGPWSRKMSRQFDSEVPQLFRPSLAWNILFDREPLSNHALALSPPVPGGQMYFLVPRNGKMFVGTGHHPWTGKIEDHPRPSEAQLDAFIKDINQAVPGLALCLEDINRIFVGLLPARKEGLSKLAVREVIVDHSKMGGPTGLWSVSGVKFTTARLVADKLLKRLYPNAYADSMFYRRYPAVGRSMLDEKAFIDPSVTIDSDDLRVILQQWVREGAVMEPDDLIFRRTRLWDYPEIATTIKELFD